MPLCSLPTADEMLTLKDGPMESDGAASFPTLLGSVSLPTMTDPPSAMTVHSWATAPHWVSSWTVYF